MATLSQSDRIIAALTQVAPDLNLRRRLLDQMLDAKASIYSKDAPCILGCLAQREIKSTLELLLDPEDVSRLYEAAELLKYPQATIDAELKLARSHETRDTM